MESKKKERSKDWHKEKEEIRAQEHHPYKPGLNTTQMVRYTSNNIVMPIMGQLKLLIFLS